jgi:hypothetical protein
MALLLPASNNVLDLRTTSCGNSASSLVVVVSSSIFAMLVYCLRYKAWPDKQNLGDSREPRILGTLPLRQTLKSVCLSFVHAKFDLGSARVMVLAYRNVGNPSDNDVGKAPIMIVGMRA